MQRKDIIAQIENILTRFPQELGDDFVQKTQREIRAYRNRRPSRANALQAVSSEDLKIAVVGAFSCGKSFFINSILNDEEIAPVEITPLTHGVTSFIYGDEEKYLADGIEISRQEYQKQIQDGNNTVKHFVVHYPDDKLKNFEIMDSPGFGSVSGNGDAVAQKDTLLSEEAVNLADVVFFLTNITEGVIQGDALPRLEKICNEKSAPVNSCRKIYVILTWADQKAPAERRTIQESIQKLCDKRDLPVEGVFVYSSKPLEEFKSATTKDFFAGQRKKLFALLSKLRDFSIESKQYRRTLTQQSDDAALQKLLRNFLSCAKKVISSGENIRRQDMERTFQTTWCDFHTEATEAIYKCFCRKDEKHHDKLVASTDDGGRFRIDYTITIKYPSSIVFLTDAECRALTKKITTLGKKFGGEFTDEQMQEFLTGLADLYHNVCFNMIHELDNGEEEDWVAFWNTDKIDARCKEIREELTDYFQENAEDQFSEKLENALKEQFHDLWVKTHDANNALKIAEIKTELAELQKKSGSKLKKCDDANDVENRKKR